MTVFYLPIRIQGRLYDQNMTVTSAKYNHKKLCLGVPIINFRHLLNFKNQYARFSGVLWGDSRLQPTNQTPIGC